MIGPLNPTDLGIRVMLWMGKVVPLPAPPWFSQALQRIEVHSSADGDSGFELTFALSRDTPVDYTGLIDRTLDPWNRVIIGVVMGAVPEVLIDGVITNQQFSPSDQPGKTTITVTGGDVTEMMKLDVNIQPYPQTTDAEIVTSVLQKYAQYGLVPSPLPTPEIHLDIYKTSWKCGETDLDTVQRLAKNNGYVFYVEPVSLGVNKAYFGLDQRGGAPQSALTVNMGAASNVSSLSFKHDARAPVTVTGHILDTLLNVDMDLPSATLAYLPPLALRPTQPRRTVYLEEVATEEPAQAALRVLSAMAPGRDAVTCDGTLDGVRYGGVLKARRPVGVRGAGLSYDGTYYVKRVSHVLEKGRYTQSFSLAREGLGALAPVVRP
jgi:hypothetical protein